MRRKTIILACLVVSLAAHAMALDRVARVYSIDDKEAMYDAVVNALKDRKRGVESDLEDRREGIKVNATRETTWGGTPRAVVTIEVVEADLPWTPVGVMVSIDVMEGRDGYMGERELRNRFFKSLDDELEMKGRIPWDEV